MKAGETEALLFIEQYFAEEATEESQRLMKELEQKEAQQQRLMQAVGVD